MIISKTKEDQGTVNKSPSPIKMETEHFETQLDGRGTYAEQFYPLAAEEDRVA